MDGGSWGWLDPRTDELWSRQLAGAGGLGGVPTTDVSTPGAVDSSTTTTTTTTTGLTGFTNPTFRIQSNSTAAARFNELRFAPARSIRTSTIILACFNVVAAFATAFGILWDSYSAAKRKDPKYRFRARGFAFVRAGETYPLILACGIVVQGIVFAVSQSFGLDSLLKLGCTLISQLMFPAVFIVPYIQLIFGLEVTTRSFRRRPFPARRKWTVAICMAIVGTLLLIHYLVSLFIRPPSFCFASLFWFLATWTEACFALLAGIAAVLLFATAIVVFKLKRHANIDPSERRAASRMVYYMAIAVISNTLLTPFFYSLAFTDQRKNGPMTLELSLVSSVVANVSGLLTGGLHLFLRSNTISTIGPKDQIRGPVDKQKQYKSGIKIWPSNRGTYNSASRPQQGGLHRVDSTEELIRNEKEEEQIESPTAVEKPNPLRANAPFSLGLALARAPAMAQTAAAAAGRASSHTRKSSYSLFPGKDQPSTNSVTLLPSTTYAPSSGNNANANANASTPAAAGDMILRPPPSLAPASIRHRRDSSMASLATVQIGLRLSNVEDMPPLNSRYFQDNGKVYNLDCPEEMNALAASMGKRPSPLSSSTLPEKTIGEDPKKLPTIPGSEASVRSSEHTDPDAEALILSPKVYSPGKQAQAPTKLPSPRGVGFNPPAASPRPPPQPQPHKEDYPRGKKQDWI